MWGLSEFGFPLNLRFLYLFPALPPLSLEAQGSTGYGVCEKGPKSLSLIPSKFLGKNIPPAQEGLLPTAL